MHFPAHLHQQAALLPRQQPARGFTLIELLVTVLLSVVLAVIAVPNLQDFSRASQVRSTAKALENGFRFARAQAIRRQDAILVCQLNLADTNSSVYNRDFKNNSNDFACPTSFSNQWQKGWVVLPNPASTASQTTGNTSLLVGEPTKAPLVTSASSPSLIFTPSGATNLSTNFVLTVSPAASGVVSSSVITVYPSGLIERTVR